MVFAEATSVLPLIASDAYHRQNWKNRERRNFQKLFIQNDKNKNSFNTDENVI